VSTSTGYLSSGAAEETNEVASGLGSVKDPGSVKYSVRIHGLSGSLKNKNKKARKYQNVPYLIFEKDQKKKK
jgi:hypothetical protein